jgi:hypothetical protein
MKQLLALSVLALAGCITQSPVVPTGPGSYMVTSSMDACSNCGSPQIKAAQIANTYCDSMHKTMLVQSMTQETFDISFGHKATLMFTCLEP